MVCSFCLAEFVVPAFGWMPCSSRLFVWFFFALCSYPAGWLLLVILCLVQLLCWFACCLLSLFLFVRIVGIFLSLVQLNLCLVSTLGGWWIFPLLGLRICARLTAGWLLLAGIACCFGGCGLLITRCFLGGLVGMLDRLILFVQGSMFPCSVFSMLVWGGCSPAHAFCVVIMFCKLGLLWFL
jgi:hypothetical protein